MQIKLLVFGLFIIVSSCGEKLFFSVEEGVSKELASQRKRNISFVSYDMKFSIPEQKDQPVTGSTKIGVKLKSIEDPLVLDFNPEIETVSTLKSDNIFCKFE